MTGLVRRLRNHGRGTVEAGERLAERLGAQGAFAVRQVLRLVAVREGDVREMDMERRALLEHAVGRLEDLDESLGLGEAAVCDRVQVGEVDDRADPAGAGSDREHVLGRPELADAAHDLDPERDRTVLALEPLAQLAELLDDRVDRVRPLAAEQEARVKDDELGAGSLGDSGRVVEHPDGHSLLLVALDMPHEPGDRRVDGEHDPGLASELAEALRPGVIHPELTLEVDLAGRVPALLKEHDRCLRTLPRGNASRSESKPGHGTPSVSPPEPGFSRREARSRRNRLAKEEGGSRGKHGFPRVVRPPFYAFAMAKRPTRIDLLELDIDLRLADLWREAGEIEDWNIEVVAAFMRAAYGKGYCDALTEDSPGSLCEEHGYRVPARRAAATPEV
jgi:hypothetical protein